ncbi:MAG: hypothetical protein M1816_004240 [Peltula sp. TS41687]|nr:MAG: hypothetical protein M1816_004240 [Peltula sp. TS41687]
MEQQRSRSGGEEEAGRAEVEDVKKRLEVAQSDDLGEKVERNTWIGLFMTEVDSKRTRLNELQRLAKEAKRDLDSYNRWLQARHNEWDEFTEEGKRLVELETKSVEYRNRSDKLRELEKRAHSARIARFTAKEEVEFAEEILKIARSEDLAAVVERTALIKRTQKEVRFAEFHLEEEKGFDGDYGPQKASN